MKYDALIATEYRIEIEADNAALAEEKARAMCDKSLAEGGLPPRGIFSLAVPGSIGHSAQFKAIIGKV